MARNHIPRKPRKHKPLKQKVILDAHPEHGRVLTELDTQGIPRKVCMPSARHLIAREYDPDEVPMLSTIYSFLFYGDFESDIPVYRYIAPPHIEGVL